MMTDEPVPDVDARLASAYAEGAAGPTVHPHDAAWERLACGELTADERRTMADHLGRCRQCLAVYRAVATVAADARVFDPDAPAAAAGIDAGSRRAMAASGRWQGATLAATLALAISGAVYYSSRPAMPLRQTDVSAATPITPAVTRLAFEAPDVRLPASLTVAMRGSPGSTDRERFLDAFGAAMVPYRARQYDAAAQTLRAVTSRFPDVQEGWVYLGVSELLSARPAAALAAFAAAGDGGALNADLPWYVAVAHERQGNDAARTAALRRLCDAAGPYTTRACAALGTPVQPR